MSTNIEKKSLEAHVELCAERYDSLAEKNTTLQSKIDELGVKVLELEKHMIFIRETIAGAGDKHNKQIIAIGTTVFGVLLAGIITLIINLVK